MMSKPMSKLCICIGCREKHESSSVIKRVHRKTDLKNPKYICVECIENLYTIAFEIDGDSAKEVIHKGKESK